ncbi:MAG TPA: acyltransferase [Bacteroidia bacterium]|jgi:peptidoglycan/LPS O-acetylase OafA/YrhL|nr:acyltransferase [Bacteroidia bacterium]
MQNKPGEIPILDNLRAIAAWSVCLYHFICTTTGLIGRDTLLYKTFYFGQFGVHLFFIISGMVIPWALYKNGYQIKNIFRFLVKRLIRLEPPYLFSIVLVVTVLLLRKYSPSYDGIDREITAKQVFLHLGYLVPFFENVTWLNNVYWTLAIEFQYYFAIALLYFLFVSPLVYVRMAGYLLLMAAPLIPGSSDFLPFWLPLFGVGIVLFLYKAELIKEIELCLVIFCFVLHLWFFNSPVTSVIAAAAGFVIMFLFAYTNRILSFFGKFSYSVYLIHPVLGATFVNVFSHNVSGVFAKFMLVSGGLVITAIGSYLMYLLVEKPSKKLSSKLSYKTK